MYIIIIIVVIIIMIIYIYTDIFDSVFTFFTCIFNNDKNML